jgi:hypothetical protein
MLIRAHTTLAEAGARLAALVNSDPTTITAFAVQSLCTLLDARHTAMSFPSVAVHSSVP